VSTVDELFEEAAGQLRRLTPEQALEAMRAGAHLVDIRGDAQRAADGDVPGARVIARNVLEWRLDPASEHRDPVVGCASARVVLLCDEGYQSCLAAATVKCFGLADVTDVVGGFQAWRAAGLPVSTEPRRGSRA
jgi:rhodanese-related sulfurtransferase